MKGEKMSDYDFLLKILVVGASGVGKTTLLEQFAEDKSRDLEEKIGVKFFIYDVISDDVKIRFQIWDIVDNEKFEEIRKQYYRGALGAIMIFDLSRPETLEHASKYIKEIKESVGIKIKKQRITNIPFLLVGNKADLIDDIETFDRKPNIKFAKNQEIFYYIETSVKNIENFEEGLIFLFHQIIDLFLLEFYKKKLNIKILMLLYIYNELSLAKIANLLNKSKATISRYTKSLIWLGLIKSYSKENEIQPGSIKKKYYTINYDFNINSQKLDFITFNAKSSKELLSLRIELRRKLHILSMFQQFGQLLNNFIGTFPGGKWNLTSLILSSPNGTKRNEITNNVIDLILKITMTLRFLNENQYKKLRSLKREFNSKLNKILEDDDGSEKTFVYIDAILPILQLMKLE